MSDVRCRMSDVRCPEGSRGKQREAVYRGVASIQVDIGHRTSDIEHPQWQSLAQIRFLHLGIGQQAFGVVFHDNAAGLNDVAAVREFERQPGVLFHQQDG